MFSDLDHERSLKLSLLSLLACLAFLVAPVASAASQPNIVLVFLDNFGWGEPGFNGGGIVRGAATPRMDQVASEGLRLTNFNVEVQCTPCLLYTSDAADDDTIVCGWVGGGG